MLEGCFERGRRIQIHGDCQDVRVLRAPNATHENLLARITCGEMRRSARLRAPELGIHYQVASTKPTASTAVMLTP